MKARIGRTRRLTMSLRAAAIPIGTDSTVDTTAATITRASESMESFQSSMLSISAKPTTENAASFHPLTTRASSASTSASTSGGGPVRTPVSASTDASMAVPIPSNSHPRLSVHQVTRLSNHSPTGALGRSTASTSLVNAAALLRQCQLGFFLDNVVEIRVDRSQRRQERHPRYHPDQGPVVVHDGYGQVALGAPHEQVRDRGVGGHRLRILRIDQPVELLDVVLHRVRYHRRADPADQPAVATDHERRGGLMLAHRSERRPR